LGTLTVNTANTNTGTVTVNAGTLAGSGSFTGNVVIQNSATLSPGNSPGVLTVGNLTLAAGSNFVVEITGPAAGVDGYDQVIVYSTSDINIGGSNLVLSILGPYHLYNEGDVLTLIDNQGDGVISGTF